MSQPWWAHAVIYQVYLRSFADGDGDGNGDIAGLLERLPHISALGVDAIWINPWFRSPMIDHGYDVSDYRDIDPIFGTLAQADDLIAEAHRVGLRVILDFVANHTSDQHPWFRAALASAPGSPERDWYFFRDGRGSRGEIPPNDWISAFGGPAWTRVTEPDGAPGQWYLHLFAPEQPDVNWANPEVAAELTSVLRFWFDRGVDGVRIDAASALAKFSGLPDFGFGPTDEFNAGAWVDAPMWDVDDVHDILRSLRLVADECTPPRMLLGEVGADRPDRFARYLRPDELHAAFQVSYLKAPWEAAALRGAIDAALHALADLPALPTWTLSTHDETRPVTRLAQPSPRAPAAASLPGPPDIVLGTRRARAAILLTLALPGRACIYQGDELGLHEADIPDHLRQDPIAVRSGGRQRGRDGCRVPIPWQGSRPPFGFGPGSAQPWLPQPDTWSGLGVEEQERDEDSMLALYRRAIRIRQDTAGFATTSLTWNPSPSGVLDFQRAGGVRCVVNISGRPIDLDPTWEVIVASEPVSAQLPPDAAAWLRPAVPMTGPRPPRLRRVR
jgi:alpha-glucosidase